MPAEGPTTSPGKNKKKLPGKALAALRHLHECLADRGRLVPDNDRVPAGIKAVTTKEWREHLEKAGVVNGKGNPRQELSRICVTLTNAGSIGIWDDFAWAVT